MRFFKRLTTLEADAILDRDVITAQMTDIKLLTKRIRHLEAPRSALEDCIEEFRDAGRPGSQYFGAYGDLLAWRKEMAKALQDLVDYDKKQERTRTRKRRSKNEVQEKASSD